MTRGHSRRTNRGSRIWALILAYGLVATQLTIIAPEQATAASPVGTEFRVNNANTEPQYTRKNGSRSVAMTNGGNSVVTWWSEAQDADGANEHNVYVRTFDAAGNPISGEIRANADQTRDQDNSAVGMDSGGNFVVSWAHRPVGITDEIYARVFNAAGVPQTGDLPINQTSTGTQAEPSIAVAPNGDFVVVWHGQGPGDTDGIFARRYNANGTPKAGEFLVNTTTPGAQINPVAATDSAGNFIVVWDGAGAGDADGVFARRVNNDGTFLDAAEFLVNTASGVVQQEASVDMDTNGDFVVTWTHSGTPKTVHAKAYNPALGSPGQFLVPTGAGEHSRPSVSTADTGAFSISWQTNPGDTDGWGVNLRDYLAVGSPAGPQVLVNTSTALAQKRAGVAVAPNGNTSIVIWEGNGTQTGHVDDQGVFAQIFAPDYAGPTYYTVANTNTSGPGSLAAAVAAANSACPASPVIEYNIPTGDGGYDSGRNVWTINGSGLHTITCDNTVVDGFSQETNQGIANGAGPFGTGGTVGLDLLPLAQVDAPEVELQNTRFGVQANNVTIQGLAFFANPTADINVTSGSGTVIQNNILGDDAVYSTSSPAVARQSDRGVVVDGGDGTIRNNLAVHHKNDGLETTAGGSWLIEGNEIRNNGLNGSLDDGIVLRNVTGTVQGNLIHFESDDGVRANAGFVGTIINNTFASIPDDGLVVEGSLGAEVARNIFQNNGSNGVEVRQFSDNIRISDNSFLNNGGLSIELVPGAGGDNLPLPNTAVPPACGLDGVGVGNQGLDKPVISSATKGGASSSVSGQVCAGALVEVYKVANSDGFGEGSQLIGSTTADGVTGDWTVSGITGLVLGDEVTALAIQFPADSNSRTSEMAANATVTAGTGSIGNKVWFDSNRDGIWTSGENIDYSGVTVRLWSPGPDTVLGTGDDVLEGTDTTDGSETYGFSGLAAGDYRVEVDESTLPDAYVNRTTYDNPWDITLGVGETNNDIDFGFFDNNSASSWRDVDPEGGVLPGQIITYMRSHTNTGPPPDTNARFENPLPVGTTYVPGSTLVEVIPVPRYLDRLGQVHYNNSNSTGEFESPWFENGEPTDHTTGDWQIANDPTFNEAFRKGGAPGTSIHRLVTTTAYVEGYFGYSYRRENVPAGVTFEAQVSSNGLAGPWTTVGTVDGAGAGATDPSIVSIPDVDISAFMTGNTAIRFVHSAGVLPAGSYVYFDFVEISAVGNPTFSGPGGAPPLLNTGVTLNQGEQLKVTFQVQVDDPTAETQVSSTATRRTDIWGDSTWSADINPIVSMSADAGAIVINEVLANETWGIDANDEFVELYNAGGSAVALDNWELASSGWGLDGDGYTFPLGTTLNPGEYAVLWSGPAGATQTAPGASFEDWLGENGDLDDPGDNLWLWDAAGDVVDFMAWGTGGPSPGHATLWDATDQASLAGTAVGQSISLTPNGTDPNDSGCWEPTTSGDAGSRCGGAPVTIDSAAGAQVLSAGATNNAPTSISGAVYNDSGADGSIAADPTLPNVGISLYQDDGDDIPNGADTLITSTTTSDPYNFGSLGSNVYWVAVDSRSAGLPATSWYEQTYGPVGGWCDNPSGTHTERATAGPCFAGYNHDRSDDLANLGLPGAEHIARIDLTGGGNATNVDFGFSVNVVTTTRGGDSTDDDGTNVNRTIQGSLRQFIRNANATAGPNAMRFVPVSPTNASSGLNEWWSILVTSGLPAASADGTTIDGSAFDYTDGTTPRTDNGAAIGSAVTPGLDGAFTTPVLDPELEIIGDRIGTPVRTGIYVTGDNVTVRDLAIYGFGDPDSIIDGDVHFAGANNGLATRLIVGSGPAATVAPPAGAETHEIGIYATASSTATVSDSIVRFVEDNGVMAGTSAVLTVQATEFVDNRASSARSFLSTIILNGVSIDQGGIFGGVWGSGVTVSDSTITNVAQGLRLENAGSSVTRSIITNNDNGVYVGSTTANQHLISENHFGSNSGQAILLLNASKTNSGTPLDCGYEVGSVGNDGIDLPVITSAVNSGASTTVTGTACASSRVEIYRATAGSGDTFVGIDYGEGTEYMGFATANASGDWNYVDASLNAFDDISAIVIDGANNTSEFGANFVVTGNQTISGTVFEDIIGDALAVGALGDTNNPGVGNVVVSLYRDGGDLEPDGADDVFVTSTVTSSVVATLGQFSFPGLTTDLYWVSVDSVGVSPAAGTQNTPLQPHITTLTGADDVWAEQTYGPLGAVTQSGAVYSYASAAGPAYAGRTPTGADGIGFANSEHIARVDLPGGDSGSNIDFGFSFNAVTHVDGGDGTDLHASDRIYQGSLRQFLHNSNAIVGRNEMRFVPTVATNGVDGTNNWWILNVSDRLALNHDVQTILDGTAYDASLPLATLDTNLAAVGYGAGTGTLGVVTTPILNPELEIRGDGIVATGLSLDPGAHDSAIRNFAVTGFTTYGIIVTGPAVTPIANPLVQNNVVGTAAGTMADTPATKTGIGISVQVTTGAIVSNNVIAYPSSAGLRLMSSAGAWAHRNEVRETGSAYAIQVSSVFGVDSSNTTISNNHIVDSGLTGVDIRDIGFGSHTITSNTIAGSGRLSASNVVGVRLVSSDNRVLLNQITSNDGSGVTVAGSATTPSINNEITQNEFGGNGLIAIDLVANGGSTFVGDGITPNDGGNNATTGNLEIDFPVITTADVGTGTVSGTACATCDVEIYLAVADGDGSDDDGSSVGHGEGIIFLTRIPQDGLAAWSATGLPIASGQEVSAIAIDSAMNTSEFAANVAVNNAPVFDADLGDRSDPEGTVISLSASATDPDPDTLVYSATGLPPGLTINTSTGLISGTLTYTATGSYPVVLTVIDGNGGTDTDTFTWTVTEVNRPPVANDATFGIDEDAADNDPVGTVSATDPDTGDTLSYAITLGDPSGSFDIDTSGNITVVDPPGIDYETTTTYTLTVTVTDNGAPNLNDTATITVNVGPVNDNTPVANNDTGYTLAEGGSLDTTVSGDNPVLFNDTDADIPADTLTVTLVTGPSFDTAFSLASATGHFTYTHDGSENLADSFTYTVSDGTNTSPPATVTITITGVNDPPTAVDDPGVGVNEGAAVPITVLSNDSDPDDGLDVTSVVATNGTFGTTSVNPVTGVVTYTHNGTENFADSFTYTVEDAAGQLSNVATVTISITAVNDPPTAVDDPGVGVNEGASVPITVLSNDSDPDDGLDVTSVVATNGTFGTTSVNPVTGLVTYTHNGTENFADTFTYTVEDAAGQISNVATVTIAITAVNDPPVAADDAAASLEDTSVTINLVSNDTDVEDVTVDPTSVVVISGPSNGLAINNNDGTVTYEPNFDFNGSDSFTYIVDDSNAATSNTATVTLTVTPVNDAPRFDLGPNQSHAVSPGPQSFPGFYTNESPGPANESGQTPLILTVINDNPALFSTAPAINQATGELTYTPAVGVSGTAIVTVTLQDPGGQANGGDDTLEKTFAIGVGIFTISKIADVGTGPVLPGSDITYTVQVENNDTVTHTNISVTDPPPSGTTWQSTTLVTPALLSVGDNFDTVAYTNQDGTASWTSPWTETNDDGNPASGTIRIADDPAAGTEFALVVAGTTRSIERSVDLSLASSAVLSFDYMPNRLNSSNDYVWVDVWDGSTWTAIHEFHEIPKQLTYFPFSIDISDYANASTRIRFRTGGQISDHGIHVNNLAISYAQPGTPTAGTAGPVHLNGLTLRPGDSATVTMTVTIDDPPTTAPIVNTATVTSDQSVALNASATTNLTNRVPVANDDGPYVVAEGGSLSEPAPSGVLANDTDPDVPFDTLTASLVSGPSQAIAFNLNADGSFSYTHNGSETVSDTFTYTTSDGTNTSAAATATITITPVNDPPTAVDDPGVGVNEGAAVVIPVLTNDTDPDDGLDVTSVVATNGTFGTTLVNATTGEVTYTHNGTENFADTFTYTVEDAAGQLSNVATVTIAITAVNDPPTAVDDPGIVVLEAGSVPVAVLGNDSDPDDGINPTTVVASNGSHGTTSVSPAGIVTYTHNSTENFADTFTYTVEDAAGQLSNVATVTIAITAVNDPPTAVDDPGVGVNEGASVPITVLSNDSDPDDGLDVTSVVASNGTYGTTSVSPAGIVTYTHNGTENFADTLTYTVEDAAGQLSNVATVTIAITPVNDPPTAVDDPGIVVLEAGSVPITVLSNDSDPDDGLDVTSVVASNGTYGTTSVNPVTGVVTYTHNGTENFADTFTYTVEDAAGQISNVATVTIAITPVNDPPVLGLIGPRSGDEQALLSFTATALDPELDGLLFSLADGPVDAVPGLTNINPTTGLFTWTPDEVQGPATYEFYIVVTDDGSPNQVAQELVTFTINEVNTAPVAGDDVVPAIDEGTSIAMNVTVNDWDVDLPANTLTWSVVTPPTHASSFSFNATGLMNYTHDGSENFTDSFTYRVFDGTAFSPPATVSLSFNPVNDPPTAVDDPGTGTITVAEGGAVVVDVLANDSDPDDGLDATSVAASDGTFGTTSVNPTTGVVTYTHNGTENFSDTFTYTVEDAAGQVSNTATVTITITPVNDPPTAVDDPPSGIISVAEGGSVVIGVLANDSDIDGTLDLTSVVAADGTNGTTSVNAITGDITYTHNGSETTSDTFTYTVEDNLGLISNTATVTVSVTATNDPPVASDATFSIDEDAVDNDPVGTVSATDPDVADTLSYVISSGDPAGSFDIDTSGNITVVNPPGLDFESTTSYTLVVTVSDDGTPSLSDTATITVNVGPVNDNSPIGLPDILVVSEGGGGVVNVLANDTDPDLPNDFIRSFSMGIPPHASTTSSSIAGNFTYGHDGSENHSDVWIYRVVDAVGNQDIVTLNITITPVNDNTPIPADDGYTLAEGGSLDTSVTIDPTVLANDTDADAPGDTLTAALVSGTSNGVLSLAADGNFTYSHDGSEILTDSFTYEVFDGVNTSVAATVTLTITPVNDNTPVATDDALLVLEGGSNSVDVKTTDSDLDLPNDTLTIVAVTNGTYGTATTDGTSVTYNHDGTENFADTLTYTLEDAAGQQDTAFVTVTVTPVNDNPPVGVDDGPYSVLEAGTIDTIADVLPPTLANDTDLDTGDTLTASRELTDTGPTYGSLSFDAAGHFVYTHDGTENFTDSFTYTVTDAVGATDTATVTINITAVNEGGPTAVPDGPYTTTEGATIDTVVDGLSGVLANDTDPDLPTDTLVASQELADTGPSYGTLTLNADGSFIYGHNGTENFTDSFTYTVTDDGGNTDSATVSININPVNDNPPVANLDVLTLAESGAGSVNVKANDTDPDLPNDTLTIVSVTNGTHGTASTDGTSVSYTHGGTENFTDTLTYTLEDAVGQQDTATVTITITPVNDNTPVVVDDGPYGVAEGASLDTSITPDPTVLANDSDADLPGDTLTATLAGPASHGTVVLNPNGDFTYDHDGTENFTDSFTYQVFDGANTSAVATVSISITPINDNPPVANDDVVVGVPEGGTRNETGTPLLANDTDLDTGDTLTASRELTDTGPSHGAITVNPDGTYIYVHDDTENFTDSFTYTVTDAGGNTDQATVSITIDPVNDNSPVALADSGFIVPESGFVTGSVATNDSDPDLPNDTLTFTVVTAPAFHASFTLLANGTFNYTHFGPFEGLSDIFTYQVEDAAGNIDTSTAIITITPINDNTPSAADDGPYALDEGATLDTLADLLDSVLVNDSDTDLPGDTLTAVVATPPAHGSLTLDPSGHFVYTHDGSENLTDSFTYTVYDGANTSAPANVALTMNPINDSVPVATDDVVTADEGLAASVDVLANDTDPDLPSDSLAVISVTAGTFGSATTDGTNVTYTHDGTENFGDTVTYTVTDAAGNTDTGTITVTINPTNDNGPTAIDDTATLDEASVTTVDVVGNDTDADLPNDTLTVTAVVDGAFGLATTDGTNITYTHDGSENFSDTVQYTVTDDAGNAAVANLIVTITPTNDNAPVALDDGPFVTDVAGSVPGSVLDNDTDTDGDALTASLATGPSAGTVTFNSDGTFSYTHDGSGALTDSFTYVANDGALDSAPATVSISVNVAAPPVANPDGPFSVTQGSSVSGGSVLDNDSDPAGLPLSALIATGPSNGSLTLNPNGTFTYSHNGSKTTSDSFTYVARNATTSSDPATVTIDIELLPDLAMIAVDDVATIDEDSELTIDLFANDALGNGTSFNLISINDPINGTVEIVSGGTVKYVPPAEWSGTETLVYSSTNNEGQSAEGRLIINVVPINDPPVAEDDSTETEGEITISLTNLVSDIDSSEFTFGVIELPLNGTVEIVNGRATYIPDGGYSGSDSFVYRVFDDSFATDSARIVIDVIAQDLSALLTPLTPDLDRIVTEPDPQPGGAAKIIPGFGSLDGVRLLFGEIFGHGNTFRMPLALLVAVFLASLFIGLRSGFVLAGGPLFLAPVGIKNYAGVLKREDEQILAYEGPGEKHGVIHRFDPVEKGIRGTGRRADGDGILWIEVETPEGDGWVDATFVTIDISPGAFANDEDVDRLLSEIQAALGEEDLSEVLGDRGLFVAHFAEAAHFDSEEVAEILLKGINFGFWDSSGETSSVRGDFTTMVSGPVIHVMNNAGATAANDGLEMPTEFENFNRMTFTNQITGARWSIIVDYTEEGPKLLGIWRAAEQNPNIVPLAS